MKVDKNSWIVLLIIFSVFGIIIGAVLYLGEEKPSDEYDPKDYITTNEEKPKVDPLLVDDGTLKYIGRTYSDIEQAIGRQVDAVPNDNGVEIQFDNSDAWFTFPYDIYDNYSSEYENKIYELPVVNKSYTASQISMMLDTFIPNYPDESVTQKKLLYVIKDLKCNTNLICNGTYKNNSISIKLTNEKEVTGDISLSNYIIFK